MGIKNVEEVSKFCRENIKLLSMDNIVAFLNEVKMLEDEDITLEEIISVMNIDHVQSNGTSSKEEPIDEDDEDDEDDFDIEPIDYDDYDD